MSPRCLPWLLLLWSLARAADAVVPLQVPQDEPTPLEPLDWSEVIELASDAVVVLQVSFPRAFDTDEAMNTTGTGVVVSSDGLILTNRHLCGPGPVEARAIFRNREEVMLELV